MTGTARVIRGDALALDLPDASVDLVVTSPPYFSLRSYQDGGTHYEGQVGSEATPTEFVDALIAATREMARVLKPSGSIWVNLGDSYSKGQSLDAELTVGDAGWLAGLIDADGSIGIRYTHQPAMRAPTFEAAVSVEQIDREAVERARAITGLGQVYTTRGGKMFRWSVTTQQAKWVLERIWPWLRIKQRQALAAVELERHRAAHSARGRYKPILPEWIEYRQMIRQAVSDWNQRQENGWQPPALPVVALPLQPHYVAAKSLLGVPWRYAIRCIDELGLILRAEVIWSKPNGLPESVTDRVRRSHEQWFHFTRSPRYYSAVDEIREPHTMTPQRRLTTPPQVGAYEGQNKQTLSGETGRRERSQPATDGNPLGKLPGSVWTIPTQPLKVPADLGVDHFAAFPMEWPRRIIRGWSPAQVCTACGEGRRPVSAKTGSIREGGYRPDNNPLMRRPDEKRTTIAASTLGMVSSFEITGYACACPDTTAPATPGVVLDPFGGTGTTALVAKALGRTGISNDLSADYCRLAEWRTNDPGELARAMEVEKPEPVHVDQFDLFDLETPA